MLCHGKLPNETQSSQALKSTLKRKTKTKILRLVSTGAEPDKETLESFRSRFTVNGNDGDVIKYHVILLLCNVYGEFLTFLTFRITFYRKRFTLSSFARQRFSSIS